MKHSRVSTLLVTLAVVVGTGLVLYSIGHARKSPPQDVERSLDIERYPNEPLELVDIKIRENSVKNGITLKSRDQISKWGRDSVKFKEHDEWFKHLKIRLRNISGKPIYGLSAELYFKPAGMQMLFGLALTPSGSRSLKQEPLQPGEEMDLEVNNELFNRRMQSIRQHGVEANATSVSVSVDGAWFSDDLRWARGVFLRRDPNNHKKWDAVDNSASPGASRLKQPAGFTLVSFKFVSNGAQSDGTMCQAAQTSELDPECIDDTSARQ